MKTKSTIADLYTSTDIGDLLTVVNEDQRDANNLTFTTETQVSKKDPFRSCALFYFFFQWDITFEYHFLKLCAALIITVWCAPALHPLSTLLVGCFNELHTVHQATHLRFSWNKYFLILQFLLPAPPHPSPPPSILALSSPSTSAALLSHPHSSPCVWSFVYISNEYFGKGGSVERKAAWLEELETFTIKLIYNCTDLQMSNCRKVW